MTEFPICLHCRERISLNEHHECLEEMTLEELFDSCLEEVRQRKAIATMPKGQFPEDEDFKP